MLDLEVTPVTPWAHVAADPTNRRRLLLGGLLLAGATFAFMASEARHADVNDDLAGLRSDLDGLRSIAGAAGEERADLKLALTSYAERLEGRIEAVDAKLQRIEARLSVGSSGGAR